MIAASQHLRHHSPLIFGPAMRLAWIVSAVLTISLELSTFHNFESRYVFVAYFLFYGYKTLKALLFLIFGFLTPIAFWRFRSLTYGLVIAAVSASIVEGIQGSLVFTGHSFGWLELGAKLFLIFIGFVKGLDARYEGAIRFGRWTLTIAPPEPAHHAKPGE
jgi:hypothetical protein